MRLQNPVAPFHNSFNYGSKNMSRGATRQTSYRSTFGRADNNLCSICESAVESSSHHVLCGDADRTRIYHEDVDAIFSWMRETRSEPVFAAELYEYLKGRSSRRFGGDLEEQWGELDAMA